MVTCSVRGHLGARLCFGIYRFGDNCRSFTLAVPKTWAVGPGQLILLAACLVARGIFTEESSAAG